MSDDGSLISKLEECIQSLAYKFRKHPFNFFTESDAHSFLYYYMFRFGPKELKIPYPTQNPTIRTVLIHREYPTLFRYSKKELELSLNGSRGHYDLVVLDPDFVKNNPIHKIIAKDYDECEKYPIAPPLLAAIEFKFLVRPFQHQMIEELKCDFKKLTWALGEQAEEPVEAQTGKQATNAYMLIFNRSVKPWDIKLTQLKRSFKADDRIKVLYAESIIRRGHVKKETPPVLLDPEPWTDSGAQS